MQDLPITLTPLPADDCNLFTILVSADMNDADYTESTCIYTPQEFKDVIPFLKLIASGAIRDQDTPIPQGLEDYKYELIPSDSEGYFHSPEILSITYVNDIGVTYNVTLNKD